LLFVTWIIIQTAKPIDRVTVSAEAKVAIKAMVFPSWKVKKIN
jgi:hypothetical protein